MSTRSFEPKECLEASQRCCAPHGIRPTGGSVRSVSRADARCGKLLGAWWLALLLAPAAAWAGPEIQRWQTDNGARVYFVEAHDLPMVDVRVVLDAGSSRDGARPGVAALTNATLDEGAGDLGADEIADAFASLGARTENGSLRDMAVMSLRTLSDPELMNKAVSTFALLLTHPRFAESALERIRGQIRTALRQQQESPGEIAERAFYRAVYGQQPYANPPLGTLESLDKLTRADVLAYYQRYYVARNAVVAIVGDLDRKGAQRVAEAVVGGLPAGEPAPPLPDVPPLTAAHQVDISHPSVQTSVLKGQPGMRRGDPDYFPLYVGNHILGGNGLVSLLAEDVRERRGLSYSVYSYFVPMRTDGPFVLGLQTRNDQTAEALKVMRATLERFVAEGPTEEELAQAKQNITGGFALRIDSNKKILDYLAVIGFYDLPLDYLDTFNVQVNAVTREQVRDAFQRRIHPDRMVTVVVGGSTQK